jgi:hypothetical protein
MADAPAVDGVARVASVDDVIARIATRIFRAA